LLSVDFFSYAVVRLKNSSTSDFMVLPHSRELGIFLFLWLDMRTILDRPNAIFNW
jgi:hypothetical protein